MNFNNNSDISETSAENTEINEQQYVLISYEALEIIQIVNHLILSGTVCFVGSIVNIINMIIFVKQGLSNTVNISMFAIAVSDLCSLVTLEWLNININLFMENADVPFEPSEIQYLTGGWPHACFLQITIWITVYVTAERFLCIAIPLKVKLILTPFRTKLIIILIYFLMFLALSPEYVTWYFEENFYPARNETRIGLNARSVSIDLEQLVFMLFAIMGIVFFITLILFTCLLVITLNGRSKWRNESTIHGDRSQAMSKRDKKTMTMVGLIAGVLIICAAPGMFLLIAVFIEPEFNLAGKFATIAHTSFSISFLSEAINSTVNILFFYKMSTKFRTLFHELFAMCRICGRGDPHIDRGSSSTLRGVASVSSNLQRPDDVSTDSSITNSRTALPV